MCSSPKRGLLKDWEVVGGRGGERRVELWLSHSSGDLQWLLGLPRPLPPSADGNSYCAIWGDPLEEKECNLEIQKGPWKGPMQARGPPPPRVLFHEFHSKSALESINKPISSVSSVTQLCLTLRPHELQHARPPCPSPTPRVHSDSRPSSQ